MNIRALDPVDADLLSAARYLEGKRPGAGARLLQEYQTALASLERFPALYPLVWTNCPDGRRGTSSWSD